MGRLGLTVFHNNQQFSGYDLRVWAMVTVFFFLWLVILLTALTWVGTYRRRLTRPRTYLEKLTDISVITGVSFILMFTSAVVNQTGHGITYGVVVLFYMNTILLGLWILFSFFIKNRLWDWILLVPLIFINIMLWSESLHSANGVMDPSSPQRIPH